ncbi:hypothetical protein PAXINDRAFT_19916 [Paxillus involutus ATCC 200175]|uniref:Uncharacterized protein n=1 Tax=Paxillus involutus ATCC 200175 TaxID=664439 RepID=A0A0C9THR9_PAXIN|nr:hypothetical protein PAXINDRAFT_19916 [Paxillus involutus ATCC 200175]
MGRPIPTSQLSGSGMVTSLNPSPTAFFDVVSGVTECLLNDNFRANLAHIFNLFSGADDRNLSSNYDGHASRVLRRLFGLDDGDQVLHSGQKTLINHLQSAVAESDASERTAATLTLLKLCEGKTRIPSSENIYVFIEQLKGRDSSLLGAHALTICLHVLEDMKQPILSNDEVLKYIVEMLRLDSFDDAIGQIEGWRVFADLMEMLMKEGNASPDLFTRLLM